MDGPLDSLDNTPKVIPGRVNPLHHSERDKERKFSRALQERMEEELEESRKEHRGDELILDKEESESGHDEPGEDSTPKSRKQEEMDDGRGDDREGPPPPAHIDVKA